MTISQFPPMIPFAGRPKGVLLVGEDRHTLEVITRVAQGLGTSVRAAQGTDTAIELARTDPPAVLVAAVAVGGSSLGVALGRAVRRRCNAAVILVGPQLTPQHAATVAAFDPDGFLCKPLRFEQVDATLRLALKRRAMAAERGAVSPSTADADQPDLANALRQIATVVHGTGVVALSREASAPGSMIAVLRPREQEVVRLLFEHFRVPAIAGRLGISPETVRNHLKNVFRRFGVHSQQELLELLRDDPSAAVPSTSTGPSRVVRDSHD